MEQSELNMRQVLRLLEKRFAAILEIARLTRELEDALGRDDRASSLLTLQMRAEAMAKADEYLDELWRMGESGPDEMQKLRSLMRTDFSTAGQVSQEEEAIYALRRKICLTVESLKAADKRLSHRVAGLKSYYETTTET